MIDIEPARPLTRSHSHIALDLFRRARWCLYVVSPGYDAVSGRYDGIRDFRGISCLISSLPAGKQFAQTGS
jgi:hypothetical protein